MLFTYHTIPIAASVEILQKEVAVHKEMVAELRTQLAEKEQEFQVSYWLRTCTCITVVPIIYMHIIYTWLDCRNFSVSVDGRTLEIKFQNCLVLKYESYFCYFQCGCIRSLLYTQCLFQSHFTFHLFPIPQELNSKAESKFNKLKAQAKTKIANLNRELEKLKAEKGGGDTSFNASTLVRREYLNYMYLAFCI